MAPYKWLSLYVALMILIQPTVPVYAMAPPAPEQNSDSKVLTVEPTGEQTDSTQASDPTTDTSSSDTFVMGDPPLADPSPTTTPTPMPSSSDSATLVIQDSATPSASPEASPEQNNPASFIQIDPRITDLVGGRYPDHVFRSAGVMPDGTPVFILSTPGADPSNGQIADWRVVLFEPEGLREFAETTGLREVAGDHISFGDINLYFPTPEHPRLSVDSADNTSLGTVSPEEIRKLNYTAWLRRLSPFVQSLIAPPDEPLPPALVPPIHIPIQITDAVRTFVGRQYPDEPYVFRFAGILNDEEGTKIFMMSQPGVEYNDEQKDKWKVVMVGPNGPRETTIDEIRGDDIHIVDDQIVPNRVWHFTVAEDAAEVGGIVIPAGGIRQLENNGRDDINIPYVSPEEIARLNGWEAREIASIGRGGSHTLEDFIQRFGGVQNAGISLDQEGELTVDGEVMAFLPGSPAIHSLRIFLEPVIVNGAKTGEKAQIDLYDEDGENFATVELHQDGIRTIFFRHLGSQGIPDEGVRDPNALIQGRNIAVGLNMELVPPQEDLTPFGDLPLDARDWWERLDAVEPFNFGEEAAVLLSRLDELRSREENPIQIDLPQIPLNVIPPLPSTASADPASPEYITGYLMSLRATALDLDRTFVELGSLRDRNNIEAGDYLALRDTLEENAEALLNSLKRLVSLAARTEDYVERERLTMQIGIQETVYEAAEARFLSYQARFENYEAAVQFRQNLIRMQLMVLRNKINELNEAYLSYLQEKGANLLSNVPLLPDNGDQVTANPPQPEITSLRVAGVQLTSLRDTVPNATDELVMAREIEPLILERAASTVVRTVTFGPISASGQPVTLQFFILRDSDGEVLYQILRQSPIDAFSSGAPQSDPEPVPEPSTPNFTSFLSPVAPVDLTPPPDPVSPAPSQELRLTDICLAQGTGMGAAASYDPADSTCDSFANSSEVPLRVVSHFQLFDSPRSREFIPPVEFIFWPALQGLENHDFFVLFLPELQGLENHKVFVQQFYSPDNQFFFDYIIYGPFSPEEQASEWLRTAARNAGVPEDRLSDIQAVSRSYEILGSTPHPSNEHYAVYLGKNVSAEARRDDILTPAFPAPNNNTTFVSTTPANVPGTTENGTGSGSTGSNNGEITEQSVSANSQSTDPEPGSSETGTNTTVTTDPLAGQPALDTNGVDNPAGNTNSTQETPNENDTDTVSNSQTFFWGPGSSIRIDPAAETFIDAGISSSVEGISEFIFQRPSPSPETVKFVYDNSSHSWGYSVSTSGSNNKLTPIPSGGTWEDRVEIVLADGSKVYPTVNFNYHDILCITVMGTPEDFTEATPTGEPVDSVTPTIENSGMPPAPASDPGNPADESNSNDVSDPAEQLPGIQTPSTEIVDNQPANNNLPTPTPVDSAYEPPPVDLPTTDPGSVPSSAPSSVPPPPTQDLTTAAKILPPIFIPRPSPSDSVDPALLTALVQQAPAAPAEAPLLTAARRYEAAQIDIIYGYLDNEANWTALKNLPARPILIMGNTRFDPQRYPTFTAFQAAARAHIEGLNNAAQRSEAQVQAAQWIPRFMSAGGFYRAEADSFDADGSAIRAAQEAQPARAGQAAQQARPGSFRVPPARREFVGGPAAASEFSALLLAGFGIPSIPFVPDRELPLQPVQAVQQQQAAPTQRLVTMPQRNAQGQTVQTPMTQVMLRTGTVYRPVLQQGWRYNWNGVAERIPPPPRPPSERHPAVLAVLANERQVVILDQLRSSVPVALTSLDNQPNLAVLTQAQRDALRLRVSGGAASSTPTYLVYGRDNLTPRRYIIQNDFRFYEIQRQITVAQSFLTLPQNTGPRRPIWMTGQSREGAPERLNRYAQAVQALEAAIAIDANFGLEIAERVESVNNVRPENLRKYRAMIYVLMAEDLYRKNLNAPAEWRNLNQSQREDFAQMAALLRAAQGTLTENYVTRITLRGQARPANIGQLLEYARNRMQDRNEVPPIDLNRFIREPGAPAANPPQPAAPPRRNAAAPQPAPAPAPRDPEPADAIVVRFQQSLGALNPALNTVAAAQGIQGLAQALIRFNELRPADVNRLDRAGIDAIRNDTPAESPRRIISTRVAEIVRLIELIPNPDLTQAVRRDWISAVNTQAGIIERNIQEIIEKARQMDINQSLVPGQRDNASRDALLRENRSLFSEISTLASGIQSARYEIERLLRRFPDPPAPIRRTSALSVPGDPDANAAFLASADSVPALNPGLLPPANSAEFAPVVARPAVASNSFTGNTQAPNFVSSFSTSLLSAPSGTNLPEAETIIRQSIKPIPQSTDVSQPITAASNQAGLTDHIIGLKRNLVEMIMDLNYDPQAVASFLAGLTDVELSQLELAVGDEQEAYEAVQNEIASRRSNGPSQPQVAVQEGNPQTTPSEQLAENLRRLNSDLNLQETPAGSTAPQQTAAASTSRDTQSSTT